MRLHGDLYAYAAANGRVRALLATLLGRAGLEALVTYPTVAAVYEALARTPYGAILEPQPDGDGQCLLGRLAEVGHEVLEVLRGVQRAFVHDYLLRHEIENLKLVIRGVHSQRPWTQLVACSTQLPGISTLDLPALTGTRDLGELVDRLARTAYESPLRGALPRLETLGPFALETAIELDHYDRLWDAAASLAPLDRTHAQDLLGTLFDVLNLTWIARYRDASGLSPEETLNYTLRQGHWVTFQIRRALAEEHPGTWDNVLARTPYAAPLADAATRGFDMVSVGLWRFLANRAQQALLGYPFHIGVPLGFLMTQEIEIRDLQILIAAKSVGAPDAIALDCLASVRH